MDGGDQAGAREGGASELIMDEMDMLFGRWRGEVADGSREAGYCGEVLCGANCGGWDSGLGGLRCGEEAGGGICRLKKDGVGCR